MVIPTPKEDDGPEAPPIPEDTPPRIAARLIRREQLLRRAKKLLRRCDECPPPRRFRLMGWLRKILGRPAAENGG